MQPGHVSHSNIQNMSTVINDPEMRAEIPNPPTVHNEVIYSVHFSQAVQLTLSLFRQNQHIGHTNSHVTQPIPVKQNAPTGGLNNVQNSRAQGIGSGSSYRTPDASNPVESIDLSFISNCAGAKNTNVKVIFIPFYRW